MAANDSDLVIELKGLSSGRRTDDPSYHGLPHFIPSDNIHIDVVLQYVRSFIDSTAGIQHGVYPSRSDVEGIWVASDGDIFLEDVKAMLMDTKAWQDELQSPGRPNSESGTASKFVSSFTWSQRMSVGRAQRGPNPWPFIMRPRPDFLSHLQSRMSMQDSSRLRNFESEQVEVIQQPVYPATDVPFEDQDLFSSPYSATNITDINVANHTTQSALSMINHDHPSNQDSNTSLGDSSQRSPEDIVTSSQETINDRTQLPPTAYGDTVINGGTVHLGNSHHQSTERESRSRAVAQNIASSATGGGLVYLGFKMAGTTSHVAADIGTGAVESASSAIQGFSNDTNNTTIHEITSSHNPRMVKASELHNVQMRDKLNEGAKGIRQRVDYRSSKDIVPDTSADLVSDHPQPALKHYTTPIDVRQNLNTTLSFDPYPHTPEAIATQSGNPLQSAQGGKQGMAGIALPRQILPSEKPDSEFSTRPSNDSKSYNSHWLVSDFQDEDIPLLSDLRNKSLANGSGPMAMHSAAARGDTEAVIVGLDLGICPDSRNSDGMTPLMLACLQGHIDVVSELLDRGAKPILQEENIDNREDLFPAVLKLALVGNNQKIAVHLMRRGLKLPKNAWIPDNLLLTPRSPYKQTRDGRVLLFDKSFSGKAPKADLFKRTSVVSLAIDSKNEELLRLVLKTVDSLEDLVDSPLHTAIRDRNLYALRTLLQFGASSSSIRYRLESDFFTGFSALSYAIALVDEPRSTKMDILDGLFLSRTEKDTEVTISNFWYIHGVLRASGTDLDIAIHKALDTDDFEVVEVLLAMGHKFERGKESFLQERGVLYESWQTYTST